jgi:hypothetical protein
MPTEPELGPIVSSNWTGPPRADQLRDASLSARHLGNDNVVYTSNSNKASDPWFPVVSAVRMTGA